MSCVMYICACVCVWASVHVRACKGHGVKKGTAVMFKGWESTRGGQGLGVQACVHA
jgi:hypothetical protein